MTSTEKNDKMDIQERSPSKNVVQKDDAWTQLLFDYHKAILSAWDLAIDMGTNWLKAQARMWSPDYYPVVWRIIVLINSNLVGFSYFQLRKKKSTFLFQKSHYR